jgi:nucleoside-diphosphate-sugar epimerase
MTVLVTGATGYIGGRLAARLVADGYDVHLLVRPQSDTTQLRNLAAHIHPCPDTCRDSISTIVRTVRPSIIFHLAAARSTDPVEAMIDANLRLGVMLTEGLLAAGGGRLVNTGTWWQFNAYGGYEPNGPYAVTKQAFQDLLRFYGERKELRATTLVLYDVYGENDPRKRLMWHLLRASHGETVALTSGLQQMRLCHVDDVVEAYLVAANGLAMGEFPPCVFVGEPAVHSVREIAEVFMTILGRPLDLRWAAIPSRPRTPQRPCPVDPALPGWQSRVSVESGVRRLLTREGLIG